MQKRKGKDIYKKGVYTDALFFDAEKLRNFPIAVEGKATVDAHWDM